MPRELTLDEWEKTVLLNAGLDASFFGDVWWFRGLWKHVGTQKNSTQSSKLVVSRRSLYPGGWGCIKKINYMSTLKRTMRHPRCRHIGACWDLLEWFQLFSTSQNTSRIQFRTFLKKNQIFWFPCCSTREDLSIDISITYVGLILTKPGRFFFSAYGNSMYGQNSILSISNFLKNFYISGFPWCSTREDHSIDVSITNVGLILTKLWWFQLFVKSQNLNFELFWKKKFWVSMP